VTNRFAAGVLVLAAAFAPPAAGHEIRPAYLQIDESGRDRYELTWKVPAIGESRLGIDVRLPQSCAEAPRSRVHTGGAALERWVADCPGGLAGGIVAIAGLRGTRTDVLARVEWLDGTTQTARLTPADTSFTVASAPTSLQVAATYFGLGVEHILGGFDHLLFVLGLLFLVRGWRQLFATVTAFTLAHSITLAAAALDLVHVPQAPIEAAISLSVMFVGAEIIRLTRGERSLTARAPWVVAFTFGLLHGFGFAGALREIGLPQKDTPLALCLFNVGVEAGQLLFIAAVIIVLGIAKVVFGRLGAMRAAPWTAETTARVPAAYVIGSVAAFWLVQRVTAFWP